MSKKISEEKIQEEYKAIEILAEELEIKESILIGIMIMKNWKKAKELTKSELENAVQEFMNKKI